MPTIQIRDVPDEVHATYRARAAAAGLSLQEYLRQELEEGARLLTPAELVDDARRERLARDGAGYATSSTAGLVRTDREGR